VVKSTPKFSLLAYLPKKTQRKQSKSGRKFAQSGHPDIDRKKSFFCEQRERQKSDYTIGREIM
jgi:hypothetical protein